MCPAELRFGTVQEFAKGKARVVFPDQDGVVSPPLPVGYARTKDDQEYDPLPVGTPVACLMNDNGESGVVLCAIYTDGAPVPEGAEQHWTRIFKDGTKLTYDRAAKALTVECEGDVTVKSKGNAKLEATGTVDVKGATVNLN